MKKFGFTLLIMMNNKALLQFLIANIHSGQGGLLCWKQFVINLATNSIGFNEKNFHVTGTKPEHFAKIAWKNHKHSTNNPYVYLSIRQVLY